MFLGDYSQDYHCSFQGFLLPSDKVKAELLNAHRLGFVGWTSYKCFSSRELAMRAFPSHFPEHAFAI